MEIKRDKTGAQALQLQRIPPKPNIYVEGFFFLFDITRQKSLLFF
jgi:hypothetical protein